MNEVQTETVSGTKEVIINLLEGTHRTNIGGLLDYLNNEGFFEAPASTRFHGSYPGGLARHSLRVYELVNEFCLKFELGVAIAPGQKPLPLSPDNIIIAGLLHDVCKVGAYIATPDGKNPYRWNKEQPKGHATLSIERIKKFIELNPVEELMVTYHMGLYGLNEFYEKGSWEFKTSAEYPLRGDHSKDEEMTKEESQAARYGNSLRNAWYHNPVCKLMYFADELATLEEKVEG